MELARPTRHRHWALKAVGIVLAAAVSSVLLGFVLGLGKPRPRITPAGA